MADNSEMVKIEMEYDKKEFNAVVPCITMCTNNSKDTFFDIYRRTTGNDFIKKYNMITINFEFVDAINNDLKNINRTELEGSDPMSLALMKLLSRSLEFKDYILRPVRMGSKCRIYFISQSFLESINENPGIRYLMQSLIVNI